MGIDLTAGGWTPKTGKIKKMCETVKKKLKLTEQDTIVIDPMSNSAFLGTDDDGRYHLLGDLQLALHPPPPPCI
jgi:hypothetical protein